MSKKVSKHSRNIFIAFILNLVFSIIEFVGGIFTNSISIISDSIHDFGDAISIAISWILEKKSEKKADSKYTYGYSRYSVLGALITSTVLLVGSIVMICNAVPRLINPAKVHYDGMIVFGILGLVANGVGAFVTSRGEKLNEKAVSLHLLEDLLGWIAVLVTSIIMKVFEVPILDPILSICITIYILWHVLNNYKNIFEIFLQKAPKGINIRKLKAELIDKVRYIRDIHHIHVWALDDITKCISMHVVIPNYVLVEDIIWVKKEIKHEIVHHGIQHVTIQIEFEGELCEDKECHINSKCGSHSHHHHHHHH